MSTLPPSKQWGILTTWSFTLKRVCCHPPSCPSPPDTCIQKVAYTTVLQEWLRLACRSDAHPELVRRHLVTFRAMSARLLDYVVNIADSNGNTALHYSVSHANFPVVQQLLDSGELHKAE